MCYLITNVYIKYVNILILFKILMFIYKSIKLYVIVSYSINNIYYTEFVICK